MLKINESNLDRALRIVLGGALLAMVFMGPRTSLGYLGLIPLVTGLVGFCPLYRILGFSTCAVRRPAGHGHDHPAPRHHREPKHFGANKHHG